MAIVGSLIRRGVQFRQWSRDGPVVNEILNLVAEAMTLISSMTRHLMEGTEGVWIVVGDDTQECRPVLLPQLTGLSQSRSQSHVPGPSPCTGPSRVVDSWL